MTDWAERIPAAIEKAEVEANLHARQLKLTGRSFHIDLTQGEVALAKAFWRLGHDEECVAIHCCSLLDDPALRAFVEKVEAL